LAIRVSVIGNPSDSLEVLGLQGLTHRKRDESLGIFQNFKKIPSTDIDWNVFEIKGHLIGIKAKEWFA
jgi:hypothetical protein